MNDAKTKQEIVDKITASTNVLVAVSNNPSVDALSAALGLTLILNKLGKHTTAIFSGAIPPAITFLDPQKTFEASTDSLRDFIIALDKEKADHLRYKVDGDMVKIFITPYRTTISSEDLEFSQGDYNVELVLALGVENQAHLDSALEAHGSILHDAAVVTLSAGEQSSSLGSVDWRDESASSLSEMLVDLADALKVDTPLLDDQIATALLTGIVAETDRFSNTRTSSKVMTIAAQLMAAGADQQLIAAKLQESHEIGVQAPVGAISMSGGPITTADSAPPKEGLAISHDEVVAPDVSSTPAPETPVTEPSTPQVVEQPSPLVTEPAIKIADAYALDPEAPTEPVVPVTPVVAPLLGGVVPPAETPVVEAAPAAELNKHSYLSDEPTYPTSMNGASRSDDGPGVDVLADNPPAATVPTATDPLIAPSDSATPPSTDPTISNRDEATRNDALAAVHASFDTPLVASPAEQPTAQPFMPAPGITLPPPPPVPDFSAFPTTSTMSSAYALDPVPPTAPAPATTPDPVTPPASPTDPAQFRIPGQ